MLFTTLYIGYRGLIQIEINEIQLINTQREINRNAADEPSNLFFSGEDQLKTDNRILIEQEKQDIAKKYIGSALTDTQKKLLLSKLDELMHSEKMFINDKLTLENVAIKLQTNTKYISQIINETYNKNFYNYINTFRVEEAKRLLALEENQKYSILGIAQSSGFVSKSAFNVAFKKQTGQTPSEFRMQDNTVQNLFQL
jgi:AraC-like DNA-binding protein